MTTFNSIICTPCSAFCKSKHLNSVSLQPHPPLKYAWIQKCNGTFLMSICCTARHTFYMYGETQLQKIYLKYGKMHEESTCVGTHFRMCVHVYFHKHAWLLQESEHACSCSSSASDTMLQAACAAIAYSPFPCILFVSWEQRGSVE